MSDSVATKSVQPGPHGPCVFSGVVFTASPLLPLTSCSNFADNATKDDKVSALQAQKAEIARRCVGCGFFRLFCGLTNGD